MEVVKTLSLFLEADQYEFEGDKFRLKPGCYFYPWQVTVTEKAGERMAHIRPGIYELRGCPADAPFQSIKLE